MGTPPVITHRRRLQYLVYLGWLIIELVFIVTCIVETRGRTLEETAALFDGEHQPQDLVHTGGEAATTTMGIRSTIQLGNHPEDVEKEGPPRDFLELRSQGEPSSFSPTYRNTKMIDQDQKHLYRINTSSSDVL